MKDTEVIAKYYELRSCRATAEYYGCCGETIRRILKRHGINRTGWKVQKKEPKYHRPAKIPYTDEQIIDSYNRLGTQSAVGNELKISQTSVYRALKRSGVEVTGRRYNGYHKGNYGGGDPAKITDTELIEEAKTSNCSEIAKRHNMSPERVYRRARRLGIEINSRGEGGHWYRRAAFHGSENEFDDSITLKKVCEKYHGVCQICGRKVDWHDIKDGHVRRDYPSVDHIVPLSKGGTHTWGNVQLAHMACNAGKRDKVG